MYAIIYINHAHGGKNWSELFSHVKYWIRMLACHGTCLRWTCAVLMRIMVDPGLGKTMREAGLCPRWEASPSLGTMHTHMFIPRDYLENPGHFRTRFWEEIGEPGGNPSRHKENIWSSVQKVPQAQSRTRNPGSARRQRHVSWH